MDFLSLLLSKIRYAKIYNLTYEKLKSLKYTEDEIKNRIYIHINRESEYSSSIQYQKLNSTVFEGKITISFHILNMLHRPIEINNFECELYHLGVKKKSTNEYNDIKIKPYEKQYVSLDFNLTNEDMIKIAKSTHRNKNTPYETKSTIKKIVTKFTFNNKKYIKNEIVSYDYYQQLYLTSNNSNDILIKEISID
jgi:hypothetical protein